MIVAGDFNVIPTPEDVYAPAAWVDDALFRPETRGAFRALVNLGLTDAYRACHDEPHRYTFWDYQAGAWQKNHGLRIDHHAAVAAGRRPAGQMRDRSRAPRLGEAVGPRAGACSSCRSSVLRV